MGKIRGTHSSPGVYTKLFTSGLKTKSNDIRLGVPNREKYSIGTYFYGGSEKKFNGFKFVALGPNTTIGLKQRSSGQLLEYSLDGENWKEFNIDDTIKLKKRKDEVLFRGVLSNQNSNTNYTNFSVDGKAEIVGNINYLWDYNDLDRFMIGYCGYGLFSGCTGLISANKLILGLQETTLSYHCYDSMFDGCINLTNIPKLPATKLSEGCYSSMFKNCTGLKQVTNILPSTELTRYCYQSMFEGCTNLMYVQNDLLPATDLSIITYGYTVTGTYGQIGIGKINCSYCYNRMFYGCKKLTTAPELPATNLSGASWCYSSMFEGCENLTKAPDLPSTALSNNCYRYMFKDCKSLTDIPELIATTLESGCYIGMFQGCTSLNGVPSDLLQATELKEYCYNYMFSGCTSLTTAPKLPATALASGCYSGMFQGCTSLVEAPDLPATTLVRYCYQNMFENCTSLSGVPSDLLPATNLSGASSCYYAIFKGCTSLTTAPELHATTLSNNCYGYMFKDCKSLTDVPELIATTLESGCYGGMFQGCTSLSGVPSDLLQATELKGYCYQCMFSGCTSLTTAPELPATALTNSCYYSMFEGCSCLTYIKCLAINKIDYDYSTYNWVRGLPSGQVASEIGCTFVGHPNADWRNRLRDDSTVQSGWNIIDATL